MEKLAHGEVVNLLIQLAVMLIAARVFAEVAQKFKQPAVVGEILAGILLGPTILGGVFPDLFDSLFKSNAMTNIALDGYIQISVVLLLFIAGLEVDLNLVLSQGKKALNISFFGLVIPFAFGFTAPFFFAEFFGFAEGSKLLFSLFMGTAMAISALPVIVRTLMDLNLFKSRMGMMIVSAAMVDDIIGWMIFSIILSFMGKEANSMGLGYTILLTVGFAGFMVTLGKSLINRILPWINKRLAWPGGLMSLSLAACFLAAAFTEYIGIHAIFGAFILGVAIGDSDHMPERAKEIIHQFVNNIFAPVFFVSIGLKVNFFTNFDPLLVIVVILVAYAGKVIGCGFGSMRGGLGKWESVAIGFGMNARGAMEIILGLIALENGLINEKLFVALVVMALVTSMTSGPLMKWAMKKKAASSE
ncbi:cation:proton antiporter [Algoriphagus sp. A40]|uniref:cation:proton antiporter n=1 Tax=Algoriphagus sp. A40 TaxID=1945863 RepID=UPI000987664F|nr:cation:proton antiporter [Algoriphagus sp. A40]OOG74333.1 cation/H(+) antiporter [Algoriphagus sp. A40]